MIRVILLRLFISWWMIPIVVLICFPIMYLIAGERAKDDIWDIVKGFWYGSTEPNE